MSGVANSNTTDYILTTPSLPFNVAAGGSQIFTLAFKPVTTGAKSATISITSNGGNATVSAAGTGVAPVMSVSPLTLSFGNQTIGTTSAAQTVTISNTGSATLNITGITSTNAEFVASPTSIASIAAGSSATLNIAFSPAASRARSAYISIISNGGNATVSAGGTGVAAAAQPILSVSPLLLTFSNVYLGANIAKAVTISNTGNAVMNITGMIKTGSAAFSFSPASFAPIAAGSSVTLKITYSPAVVGTDTGATISIASDGGNATVTLTGNAVQQTAGDVALVKLGIPASISTRVGGKIDMNTVVEATTTVKEIKATVTLKAVYPAGLKVRTEHASITETLHAGEIQPKKFKFESDIICAKKGIWPVTWTAEISAIRNSNPVNDILTGKTQVICR